jgi:hypothetical protein
MQRLNRRFPVRLPETGEPHVQKRDIERVPDKGYEPFTADLLRTGCLRAKTKRDLSSHRRFKTG